jgi:two-component system LytT family sensor kinase
VTAGAAGGQAWLVHNLWSAASQWSEAAQRTLTSPLLGLPYLIETNLQPALLLVLYYAILLRRHRTKRDEERATRLERSLFEARLHVISRQLEPHFLFNTLNAIAGLTSEQPAVAEAMLVRLSELLRIAFDSSVGETVSLQTELERLDMYTDLYCMRFGDRLTVRRVVEAATLNAAVPTFLLQPLVENAIAHGFAARRGTGAIDISARRVGARVELIVQDDGTGFAPDGQMREGVGLGSTRARLEAMFPGTHSIALQSSPDVGTKVTITFPATRVGETEPAAEPPAVVAMPGAGIW